MAFVVGLTGGIGSGKSAVSDILQKKGIYVIDADVVSREVMMPNTPCTHALSVAFPQCVTDGVVDRKKLREHAFSSPDLVQKLNSITHPYIIQAIEQKINSSNDLTVLVAPLLFEVGLEKYCNFIVCVDCDMQTRIKRVQQRDNITKELAESMIRSQLNQDDRLRRSDYVLSNDGEISQLESEVEKMLSQVLEAQNKKA